MQIYLPIAEMPINALLILAMGGAVGFLTGMFGVGGGFLMTPFLMFAGIPPNVAVGTVLTHIIASSVTGTIAQMRRRSVDFKMGAVLICGGLIGTGIGLFIFDALKRAGQIELLISVSYVFFLGGVGSLMLYESVKALRAAGRGAPLPARRPGQHLWMHGLPFKMRFRQSKLYISVIPPLVLGVLVGILAAIMGVGGGFIMVPAMIYLLKMPTNVVIGTSTLQILCTASFAALMHASQNQNVDAILAVLLIAGGVAGVNSGVRFAAQLRADQLRALLALLVVGVALRLFFDLVVPPSDPFTLAIEADS